jgi:hypothetical protein
VPVWSGGIEAGGIQIRHQYGRNGVVQETLTATPTWRGMTAYYGVANLASTIASPYRGVRDQNFTIGPPHTVVDDMLVGSPIDMFDVEPWVYGDVDGVGLVYNGIGMVNAEIHHLVDTLENVYYQPKWVVGTVLIGTSNTITIEEWIADRQAESPAPTSVVSFVPGGDWPLVANAYASWVIAFRPNNEAVLNTWLDLFTVEGTGAGDQRFIEFKYKLNA